MLARPRQLFTRSSSHGRRRPADDTACRAARRLPPTPATGHRRTEPVDDRVTIEADDKDFSFDVNGNAVLCGQRRDAQGDKVIRADRLEYDAKTGRAKLTGAVEFCRSRSSRCAAAAATTPRRSARSSKARSSSCPQRSARGAARNMQVDANGTGHAGRRHRSPPARSPTGPGRSSRSASCSTRARTRAPARHEGRVQGRAVHLSTLDDLPHRPAAPRAASSSRTSAADRATARRSRCPTTGTSGRTPTSWPNRSTTPSAAWISPASCAT